MKYFMTLSRNAINDLNTPHPNPLPQGAREKFEKFKSVMNFNNARKASVTIEVVLSVVLGLAVLFLALGIFSNHLKSVVDNNVTKSGFSNLVKEDNSTVTANSFDKKDYTKSVVNVQIAGDPDGLLNTVAAYHDYAKTQLTALGQKTPFTDNDAFNLAKWLTIYGRSAVGTSTGAQNLAVKELYDNNTIGSAAKAFIPLSNIYPSNYMISVNLSGGNKHDIDWYNFTPLISDNAGNIDDASRLIVLKALNASSFN